MLHEQRIGAIYIAASAPCAVARSECGDRALGGGGAAGGCSPGGVPPASHLFQGDGPDRNATEYKAYRLTAARSGGLIAGLQASRYVPGSGWAGPLLPHTRRLPQAGARTALQPILPFIPARRDCNGCPPQEPERLGAPGSVGASLRNPGPPPRPPGEGGPLGTLLEAVAAAGRPWRAYGGPTAGNASWAWACNRGTCFFACTPRAGRKRGRANVPNALLLDPPLRHSSCWAPANARRPAPSACT